MKTRVMISTFMWIVEQPINRNRFTKVTDFSLGMTSVKVKFYMKISSKIQNTEKYSIENA